MTSGVVLTQQVASAVVRTAVLDYFAGERSEMVIAIASILVVVAAAVWLFVASRAGFALALMMTLVLFGGVMAAGLTSLLVRDHSASRVLSDSLQSDQFSTAVALEQARIEVVVSKFRYYRIGAAVLGVLAIAGLMLSDRGWVHGVAAGLLMVVVAQVVIDHFSAQRAHLYAGKLASV